MELTLNLAPDSSAEHPNCISTTYWSFLNPLYNCLNNNYAYFVPLMWNCKTTTIFCLKIKLLDYEMRNLNKTSIQLHPNQINHFQIGRQNKIQKRRKGPLESSFIAKCKFESSCETAKLRAFSAWKLNCLTMKGGTYTKLVSNSIQIK